MDLTGRRWMIFILAVAAVTVALPWTGRAQTTETKQRMEEVRSAAAKHKSFRIEIPPPPPDVLSQSVGYGTILWAAPHFHRIDVIEPIPGVGKAQRVSVCDGKTIWSYFPTGNAAYKIDVARLKEKWSEDELERRGILLNTDPFEGADEQEIKYLKEGTFEETPCYLFEMPAPKPDAKLQAADRMVLWIGVKDGLLRLQEAFSRDGRQQDRRVLHVLELDPKTSPEDFQLKLPTNCKVEDVTDKVLKDLEEPKKAAESP
jgi:outer membrane lipoprotein-sorting protein